MQRACGFGCVGTVKAPGYVDPARPVLTRQETSVKSSNPVLTRRETFAAPEGYATFRTPSTSELEQMYAAPARMTIDDVVMRTGAMLAVLFVTGAAAWVLEASQGIAIVAALAGFVLALVISFKQITNPVAMLGYAGLEGVFLGAISRVFEQYFPGIVIQAVIGTGLVFAA